MVVTRSGVMDRSDAKASHSCIRGTESYALWRSTKAIASEECVRLQWQMRACKMVILSSTPWFARKPTYVGACKWRCSASAVRRLWSSIASNFASGD